MRRAAIDRLPISASASVRAPRAARPELPRIAGEDEDARDDRERAGERERRRSLAEDRDRADEREDRARAARERIHDREIAGAIAAEEEDPVRHVERGVHE